MSVRPPERMAPLALAIVLRRLGMIAERAKPPQALAGTPQAWPVAAAAFANAHLPEALRTNELAALIAVAPKGALTREARVLIAAEAWSAGFTRAALGEDGGQLEATSVARTRLPAALPKAACPEQQSLAQRRDDLAWPIAGLDGPTIVPPLASVTTAPPAGPSQYTPLIEAAIARVKTLPPETETAATALAAWAEQHLLGIGAHTPGEIPTSVVGVLGLALELATALMASDAGELPDDAEGLALAARLASTACHRIDAERQRRTTSLVALDAPETDWVLAVTVRGGDTATLPPAVRLARQIVVQRLFDFRARTGSLSALLPQLREAGDRLDHVFGGTPPGRPALALIPVAGLSREAIATCLAGELARADRGAGHAPQRSRSIARLAGSNVPFEDLPAARGMLDIVLSLSGARLAEAAGVARAGRLKVWFPRALARVVARGVRMDRPAWRSPLARVLAEAIEATPRGARKAAQQAAHMLQAAATHNRWEPTQHALACSGLALLGLAARLAGVLVAPLADEPPAPAHAAGHEAPEATKAPVAPAPEAEPAKPASEALAVEPGVLSSATPEDPTTSGVPDAPGNDPAGGASEPTTTAAVRPSEPADSDTVIA